MQRSLQRGSNGGQRADGASPSGRHQRAGACAAPTRATHHRTRHCAPRHGRGHPCAAGASPASCQRCESAQFAASGRIDAKRDAEPSVARRDTSSSPRTTSARQNISQAAAMSSDVPTDANAGGWRRARRCDRVLAPRHHRPRALGSPHCALQAAPAPRPTRRARRTPVRDAPTRRPARRAPQRPSTPVSSSARSSGNTRPVQHPRGRGPRQRQRAGTTRPPSCLPRLPIVRRPAQPSRSLPSGWRA